MQSQKSKDFFKSKHQLKTTNFMENTITTNQLDLIKGQFTADEAKEILTTIFLAKMKFHELKNFSTQIRTGKPDSFSQERMLFLGEELKKIELIVNEAKSLNKKLHLKSDISVSLCNE